MPACCNERPEGRTTPLTLSECQRNLSPDFRLQGTHLNVLQVMAGTKAWQDRYASMASNAGDTDLEPLAARHDLQVKAYPLAGLRQHAGIGR